MRITKIEATSRKIKLYADCDEAAFLRESVPTIGSKAGRALKCEQVKAQANVIELERFDCERDRIFSRFELFQNGDAVEGVKYVTDVADNVPVDNSPYPTLNTIKMLGLQGEYIRKYNIQQGLININLPALMAVEPTDDTMEYRFNGRVFHVRKSEVEKLDEQISAVPMMTFILLNSPKLFGSTGEKALLDACLHPNYDASYPNAFISAFDMETEEGQSYYMAFVSFLAERYTRPDRKYGHAVGAIISNEVSSQYIWGNAGEMPVEEYTREYAQALRLAWLCGQRFCGHFRVYMSLDQFWCGTCYNPAQKLRFYSGRDMIELLSEYCAKDGNFPWNLAYHPYPEDLRWPDFWHDRALDFTFSTPKITFKNMEVLEAFLSQERFLYKGKPRRIIFSEQGFNSQSGELQALTEKMAAAGYVLSYMKARKMKTVDMFTHHAAVDNPQEFGLNLGMFRYNPDNPYNMGEPKPIFESFTAMDSENEAEAIRKAREFIGEELFDYLLNPPLLYADRDDSQDNAFGA